MRPSPWRPSIGQPDARLAGRIGVDVGIERIAETEVLDRNLVDVLESRRQPDAELADIADIGEELEGQFALDVERPAIGIPGFVRTRVDEIDDVVVEQRRRRVRQGPRERGNAGIQD